LLLTTGGISVGDHDYVKEILEVMGAEKHFWRVAHKPGSPTGFWALKGKPFFGIPGNPVSAIVTAELYLQPAIKKMMGHADFRHTCLMARLEGGYRKSGDDGKRHFLRVIASRCEEVWKARTSGAQGSAQLSAMSAANALAMIPEDRAEIEDGGEVEILLLGRV
jgi:molybdopterin molybdotransferase